jgi:hypothetical protein
VAPFRHAMRLIQHPKPDLTLLQHHADRRQVELFRRDQQNGRIAHPHTRQRVMGVGERQHPERHDGRRNSRPRQPLHLIGHQRHRGRDHHGQRARLVKPQQGRDLIADRFAGAGGQDERRHRIGRACIASPARLEMVHPDGGNDLCPKRRQRCPVRGKQSRPHNRPHLGPAFHQRLYDAPTKIPSCSGDCNDLRLVHDHSENSQEWCLTLSCSN